MEGRQGHEAYPFVLVGTIDVVHVEAEVVEVDVVVVMRGQDKNIAQGLHFGLIIRRTECALLLLPDVLPLPRIRVRQICTGQIIRSRGRRCRLEHGRRGGLLHRLSLDDRHNVDDE